MTKASWTMTAGAVLLWAGTALAAPTAQQRCDGARVKAWGTYVSCVEDIVAKDAGGRLGLSSQEKFQAFAKCRHKYFWKWATLQGAAYTGSTCVGSRFTDNGDGTVTDSLSGLVWEKKVSFDFAPSGDPHDADNFYAWSTGSPYKEDGATFTSFLDTVNGGGGFGGANGWRLPTLAELQTIVRDFPCTAASCVCPSVPCVDPALDASTTQSSGYWSATSYVPLPFNAWLVLFNDGNVFWDAKTNFTFYVRAVRGGL